MKFREEHMSFLGRFNFWQELKFHFNRTIYRAPLFALSGKEGDPEQVYSITTHKSLRVPAFNHV